MDARDLASQIRKTMTEWISTKKATQMLGVSASTIKRWSLESRLPYMRTAGGHRRFNRSVVETFLKESHFSGDAGSEVAKWVRWLRYKDLGVVRGKVVRLINERKDCFAAADFLGDVVTEIGECLAVGEFSATDQHIATEKLSQAVTAVSGEFRLGRDAPLCSLATLLGERHRIGLDLTQLCLRSTGVNAQWIGVEIPVAQLVLHLRLVAEKGKMLALSASSWQSDAVTLLAAYQDIASACVEGNIELILGGKGAWPNDIKYGQRCYSFNDLKLAVNSRI
jgi:excisionase family DNA binding protein